MRAAVPNSWIRTQVRARARKTIQKTLRREAVANLARVAAS
jgi:hypothetical protein